jgi:16S rRNA pseudouridine516 synthase
MDGRTQSDPATSVTGKIVVDGEPVEAPPDGIWAILHKPVGYACSHDPAESPLVDELLPEVFRRLGAEFAGRLDRETSGLLVVTTDGALIQRLTHPKRHVTKRYRAAIEGPLAPDTVARFRAGIHLEGDDTPTLPADIDIRAESGSIEAVVRLREGRYHQVRRMVAACGGKVLKLHRDRIGGFDLPDDLAPGGWRHLDEEAIALLLKDAP